MNVPRMTGRIRSCESRNDRRWLTEHNTDGYQGICVCRSLYGLVERPSTSNTVLTVVRLASTSISTFREK
jgi:hypothetical protein